MKIVIKVIEIIAVVLISIIIAGSIALGTLFFIDKQFLPGNVQAKVIAADGVILRAIRMDFPDYKEFDQQIRQVYQASLHREKKVKNISYLPEVGDVPRITPEMENDPKRWLGQAPISSGKVIEIDISNQRFLVWQDGKLLYNYLTSTGKNKTPTKKGVFRILSKERMAYGAGDGQRWAMPYWLGIYVVAGIENGIHALPYINGRKEGMGDLGRRVSHGCIRLSDNNAETIWNWAELGNYVVVHR